MDTKEYLKFIKDEIHSVVIATVDENGLPVARVIDIMLADDNSLYFITAKGKEFYKQLIDKKYAALSGMAGGEGSLNKKAVSLRGKVKNAGQQLLSKVFEENPYMAEIYPEEGSRMALEIFQLYEGQGEYFDLSQKPIVRESFTLGGAELHNFGYFITGRCEGCGTCFSKCPQNCIKSGRPCTIKQENCLHCGNCLSVCPFNAVERK